MFYEHPSFKFKKSQGVHLESAIVVLNPAASKRLIAKAIAKLPEVKAALNKGTVVIGWGTTTAYVVEEILGMTIDYKTDFASGVVCNGELNSVHPEIKIMPFVLKDGKPSDIHQKTALDEFMPEDVFIKGANSVDLNGDIGILVAAQHGGSISHAWFAVAGRGSHFICPVGLEKLIPSVRDAANKCCFYRYKYSTGVPVSQVAFQNAKVVTEIQAVQILTGADATHVASGGIAGSEGAITLVLEGEAQALEEAFELIKGIRTEPPLPPGRRLLTPSPESLNYEAKKLLQDYEWAR
ncbi:hypothetical protein ACFLXH_04540 [Chloroflexota bacterium]